MTSKCFSDGGFVALDLTGTPNLDNWEPVPGIDPTVIRVNVLDGMQRITGIHAFPHTLKIINVGQSLELGHEDTKSEPQNRFFTNDAGTPVTLAKNDVAFLVYDVMSLRWRVLKLPAPV